MTPEFLDKFYQMMVEVRTSVARLEEKVDAIKLDVVDRVSACSLAKQEQLNSLTHRLEKVEGRMEWVMRLVVGAVILAVMYGGYVVTK